MDLFRHFELLGHFCVAMDHLLAYLGPAWPSAMLVSGMVLKASLFAANVFRFFSMVVYSRKTRQN